MFFISRCTEVKSSAEAGVAKAPIIVVSERSASAAESIGALAEIVNSPASPSARNPALTSRP